MEYSWSGTSGAALTHAVNGESPVAVRSDVADLSLEMLNNGQSKAVSTATAPTSEVLLQSHTSISNVTWHTVGYSDAYGQMIQLSLFTGLSASSGSDE